MNSTVDAKYTMIWRFKLTKVERTDTSDTIREIKHEQNTNELSTDTFYKKHDADILELEN